MAWKSDSLHRTGDSTPKRKCLQRWAKRLSLPSASLQVLLRNVPGRMRIPKHWSVNLGPQREHLLYYVLEGGFEAAIGGHSLRPVTGDLLWITPGTPFQFSLPTTQHLQIIRFRLLAPVLKDFREPGYLLFADAWPCQVWMDQIVQETGESDSHHPARIKSLLLCLVTELCRLSTPRPKAAEGFNSIQKQKLVRYAAENVKSRLEPAQLARHLELSHDYFTRLFGKSFRMSPRRWLVEQRIHQAGLRLLESTLNISQVAEDFGYHDVFLFSRQFKTIMGMAPVAYRRRGR